MKTVFLTALLALTLAASASGTKEKAITSFHLLQSFSTEFGAVDNVKWSYAMNNMTKAEFKIADEALVAYFDENGEFVASTKDITYERLPIKLQKAVADMAPCSAIKTIFEMTTSESVSWFIETNTNNQKKIWKGNALGKIVRYYVKS